MARYGETRLTADVNPSKDSLAAQTALWRASAPSEEAHELTSWADATRDEMPGITPEILAMLGMEVLVADPYVAGSYAEGAYIIALPITPILFNTIAPAYSSAFEAQRQ